MFLVRSRKPVAHGNGTHLCALLSHLRIDATWQEYQRFGVDLAIAQSPSGIPAFIADADGNWLIAAGLPSRAGQSSVVDTETLREWLAEIVCSGPQALTDSEGLYAFVAFVAATKTLSVLTDRSGMPFVYVAEDEHGVVVSSSSIAIGCVRQVRIDARGLAIVAFADHGLGNLTLFEGIERVGAGQLLSFGPQGHKRTSWWTPPRDTLRPDAAQDEFKRIVHRHQETLAARLLNGRPIVATLTAGLDSRAVYSLVAKLPAQVRYITLGETDDEEVIRASQVAEQLGLLWERRVATPGDNWRALMEFNALSSDGESHGVRGTMASTFTMPERGGNILWGLGGECYRDYWSKHEAVSVVLKGRGHIERLVNYRFKKAALPVKLFAPPYDLDQRQVAIDVLSDADRKMDDLPPLDRLDRHYIEQRMRRWASVHLESTSWYARPELPLIGQSMLELAYRLPRSVKAKGQALRWLIWQQSPAAAAITHNEGYSTKPIEHMTYRERLRDFQLDGKHLTEKLLARRHAGSEPRPTATYRDVFGDVLDVRQMKSATIYRQAELAALLEQHLDREVRRSAQLNFVLGIELALRATRMLNIN